jgi:hypothetical protein
MSHGEGTGTPITLMQKVVLLVFGLLILVIGVGPAIVTARR